MATTIAIAQIMTRRTMGIKLRSGYIALNRFTSKSIDLALPFVVRHGSALPYASAIGFGLRPLMCFTARRRSPNKIYTRVRQGRAMPHNKCQSQSNAIEVKRPQVTSGVRFPSHRPLVKSGNFTGALPFDTEI